MPDAPPLTPEQWRSLRLRALKKARNLKPDSEAEADDLVHRAFEIVFRPGGAGWTERDPKRLLKIVRRKMLNQAGWDTQRFDPISRQNVGLDDDRFQQPDTNWTPGYIPNPRELVLAKEKHEIGSARLARLTEAVRDDALGRLLIDTSFEGDEAKAEALRRGYTEAKINDARKRLRRHLARIVSEEKA